MVKSVEQTGAGGVALDRAPVMRGERGSRLMRLLPLVVAGATAGVALLVYVVLLSSHARQIEAIVRDEAKAVADQIATHVEETLGPARRLAVAWRRGSWRSEAELAREAGFIDTSCPAFAMVAWVDRSGIARWTGCAPAECAEQRGRNLAADEMWGGLLRRVHDSMRESAGPVVQRGPDYLLPVAIPLRSPEGTHEATGGAVIALLKVRSVLAPALLPSGKDSVEPQVSDGSLVLAGPPAEMPEGSVSQAVRILDRQWNLRVQPGGSSLMGMARHCAAAVLIVGLVASGLAGLGTWLVTRFRARQTRSAWQHLKAMESLAEVSAAVGAQLGAGGAVLDKLTDAAMRLMGMDRCGIALVDRERQAIDVVAFAGHRPAGARSSIKLEEMPASERIIASGQILFVEDVAHLDMKFNKEVAREFAAGCVVLIPLRVEDKPVGMMALSATQPRPLSDLDRRLAELLGSQANVILSKNMLYERMRNALDAQSRLMDQREALHAVNTAIYESRTLQESLDKVVEFAPAALGVDVCSLGLMTDVPEELLCGAATRPAGAALIGRRFNINGTRAQTVLATRQMTVVEDAGADPGIHAAVRQTFGVGSAVFFPLLRADGEPLGLLTLIRHVPGPFTAEQLDLARSFTTRAAAAIEIARLHDNAQSDAQKRAMLLGELNHRVKNSLAGIVGLLSIDRPEMSATARKWLGRVVDRIQTMAKAHELFSVGVERVSVPKLVESVLPTLSVVRPPSVVIHTDVDAVHTPLDTQQAVGLAMVLHELCVNAITHGLAGGGELWVRGHQVDGRGIVIDVCDNGPGLSSPAGDGGSGRRGVGLQLVRELVSRELRGAFRLGPRDGGGTVATIEFQPAPDDRQGVTT
jgi:two-component sensor histidine kinase/putative methionine-R-sulfoxide reductase with GAF domain